MAQLLDKYFNDTLKNNPLVYYRMREGSGTTMLDSSINANNGTYNGSGVSWNSPASNGLYGFGQANGKSVPIFNSHILNFDISANPATASFPFVSAFDGTAGRSTSTVAGINTTASTSVTVELWFKWDGNMAGSTGTFEALANFGGASGILLGFLKNGAADYRFGLSVRNTGDLWGLNNATTLALLQRDTYHHIQFVIVNNAVQTSKLYIDGIQQTMSQQIGTTTTTDSVTTAMALGYDGTASFFQGGIAEVAIYNGEIYNATAVKNRYHQGAYGGEYLETPTLPGIEGQVDIGTFLQLNINDKNQPGPANRTRTLNQFYLTDIGGMDDADIRFSEESNFYRDGTNPLISRYGGRTITLTGYIEGSNFQKMRQMQTQLKSAFTPAFLANGITEEAIAFRNIWNNGFDFYTNARKSAGVQMAESQKYDTPRRDFLLTLRSSFPYLESVGSRTDVVIMGATLALPNKGNAPAYPSLVVWGPLTDAQIIISSIWGSTNTRITGSLAASSFVTLDSKTRVSSTWPFINTNSDFPLIPPVSGGTADNIIPFINFVSVAGGTAGVTRVEITWRHTII